MKELSLTRAHLETLSTGELVKWADVRGVDISPEQERVVIIEELLSLAGEEREKSGADGEPPAVPGTSRRHFSGTAELPKQYNISFIEVIIRDPLWAFVFWEIKSHDREQYEGAPDFDGYCLRVREGRGNDTAFTVPVSPDDASWYLDFQPCGDECRVELCALLGGTAVLAAASAPFRLPRLLEPANREGLPSDLVQVYRNPLVRLSGADAFPVIRNTSRLLRIKAGDVFPDG